MEWLPITDEDNQDMSHEFLGCLIMQDGFKVRYRNIEEYTDELQKKIKKIYKKNGYEASLKYMQNFAYCEVTAIKSKPKYIDYALATVAVWGVYRIISMYLI